MVCRAMCLVTRRWTCFNRFIIFYHDYNNMLNGRIKCQQLNKACFDASEVDVIWVTSQNDIQYGDHNTEVLTFLLIKLMR